METLREIGRRHEALKKRIHNFRMPLSPRQRIVVGCFYFFTPIVGGYYVMQRAISHTDENLGPQGEKLRERVLPAQDPAHRAGTLAQTAELQRILDRSRNRSAAANGGGQSSNSSRSSA